MPEDTEGLKTGVLTPAEFLRQARLAADEIRAAVRVTSSSQFTDGFLFYYFGNVDQVSHMMWRPMDPQHPAYNPATWIRSTARSSRTSTWRWTRIVGRTLAAAPRPDDLLVIMSDHGFASWRRAFNMNTWLRDNGYLKLRRASAPEAPAHVRRHRLVGGRARTASGLNGLYVNVQGRESSGSSIHGARARSCARSATSCCARSTRRPERRRSRARSVAKMSTRLAGSDDLAPDIDRRLRQGHADVGRISAGRRVPVTSSWTTAARGRGDHCMDPASGPRHPADEPAAPEAGGDTAGPRTRPPRGARDRRISFDLRRSTENMFGSSIKLDKALLAQVKRMSDLAGYSSVNEFITHALEKETCSASRAATGLTRRSRRGSRGWATFRRQARVKGAEG